MVRQGAGARQRHPRYLPQQPVRIPTAPPCQVATKAATEGSPGERRKVREERKIQNPGVGGVPKLRWHRHSGSSRDQRWPLRGMGLACEGGKAEP